MPVKLNKQQQKALERILENCQYPISHGPSYDENMRQTGTGDPTDLLDDPRYKLGWERCFIQFKARLEMLLNGSNAELRKYAGKPKRADNQK